MKPKVMDAVGLIGRYVADNWDQMVDEFDIKDQLLNDGFSSRDIASAFKWIERNTLGEDAASGDEAPLPSAQCRPLSSAEAAKVDNKAYGLLVSYYNRGLLDPMLLEEILERAMRTESDEVGENEIRRITALALFTRVQSEWRDFLHSTNTKLH